MSDILEYTITGRSIDGDISPTDQNTTPQIDKDEFLTLLDAILSLPNVAAVKWDQYTPYFNDGDPCIFSVQEPRVIFDFEGTDFDNSTEDNQLFPGDYRDYDDGYTTSNLWTRIDKDGYSGLFLPGHGGLNKAKVSFASSKGINTEPYYDALTNFSHTSQWERVALTNFGDHAEVTATLSGFSVETYEHD